MALNKKLFSLSCGLILLSSTCGTPPKRPVFNGPDTVAALSTDSFVGSWRYSVLNPMIEEEKTVSATYRFNADGTFTANSETSTVLPMKLESVGTWRVEGELFIIAIDDVRDTSGAEISALALAYSKPTSNKQPGKMNPYTITPNRIIMLSIQNGSAIQLDRL